MSHHDDPPQRNPWKPREQPIIPGRLVVPRARAGDAAEALGLNELTPDQLILRDLAVPADPVLGDDIVELPESDLTALGDRKVLDDDREVLDEVLEDVAFFDTSARKKRETIAAVIGLRSDHGIDARPMFYCWALNHWDAQPGRHQDLSHSPLPAPVVDPGRAGWPVWVIDTGYDTSNVWHDQLSATRQIKPDDSRGGDDRDHGTFVTALIASMSPKSTINVLRTGFQHAPHKSNELAVGVKLKQAINQYQSTRPKHGGVINLSLGTYAAYVQAPGRPDEKLDPLTLNTQLQHAALDGLRVVAAAGNEWSHVNQVEIAYPASSKHAIAVGAGYAKDDRAQMEWTSWVGQGHNPRFEAPPDPSIAVLAPGVDLKGPIARDRFAAWSGSSFATALYSGYLAAHGDTPASNTIEEYRTVFDTGHKTTIIP